MMAGAVILVANAFQPSRMREVVPVLEPVTVRGFLVARGIEEFPHPTICLFNGNALLRGQWAETEIRDGDVCAFLALPHGGGGGGGGKSPLKTVLLIAVMVAAPEIASWAFPEMAAAAGAANASLGAKLAFGAVKAGIALGGAMLVNALIPSPRPAAPSLNWGGFGSTQAPSPTYSLQGQGNQARLGQPIPVIYGRHQVFPDLATEPYQEYAGNEQYLFQLHVIGQGTYEVDPPKIEDTPISAFEEVTYEVVQPGGSVTLFEPDVITASEVAGQELKGPNQLVGGDDGWIGPFVANPPETDATHLGVDVVFARGLYYANSSGGLDTKAAQWQVDARPIDDAGNVIAPGTWTTLATESHSAATNTPIRLSYKYAVTPGRYEVRMKRLDDKDLDARAGHEIRWGGLRAYLQGTPDFSGLTLLAVKMRATDNLSQRSSRQINCVVTRKLPAWDQVTQTWGAAAATRSIAWAFADVCRAEYGAKLADARIDLQALATLHSLWEGRGDHFDAVFDSGMTVWEALTRVARCGRAVPILQGGVVRIIRDTPPTLPVAMFGPRNIVKGTFRIQYVMPGEDTADAVTVEFYNSATWKPDEVTASLPDSTEANPAKVALFGCTDEAHAQREGDYMAADNRYRRKLITFQTELEGMIPIYGDLIAVTHDMPRWGQGGEVVAWQSTGNAGTSGSPSWQDVTLELSEEPDWTDGATHYVALRKRNGALAGPFEVEAVAGEPFQVRLLDPMMVTPYVGASEERTYYSFGPGQAWGQQSRVLAVRPRGERVEILSVAEDSRAHPN